MYVYMFGYGKKKNSTAYPQNNLGTLFNNVQLKEETSVLHPVLIFNPNSTGMPTPFVANYFTYAYIPTFSRYYFVQDWQYLNGVWECDLNVDVLASYKTQIGNTVAYIVRSASSYNGYITDTMYPAHTNISKTINSVNLNLNLTGFYCVGIISNEQAASQGAITYYYLSDTQFGNLKNYLMSETFLSDNGLASLQEISKDMVKVLYNPYQYIVSCKFFPIPFPTVGTDTPIKFGWWTIPMNGRKMNAGGYVTNVVSANIPTPAHPQAATRGTYLNHAPYTERYLVHPIIGTILLDSNKIDAGDIVLINMSVDGITGEAFFTVLNSTQNIPLYQNTLQLAVDIPIAQMNTDVIGMARTAINATGDVINNALSLNVGGAIASAATGILDTLQASVPILQSSPASANQSMYGIAIQSANIFHNVVDADVSDKGRPLCQVQTINQLSGFVMCSDGHVNISGYDSERIAIDDYLNTGFFYE